MTSVLSGDLVAGFPFPFPSDRYRYSTNVEPAGVQVDTAGGRWGASVVDVDGEYHREIAERAAVLAADPTRHAVLPHMVPAAWDAMVTTMGELAAAYPQHMSLESVDADTWQWTNALLGVTQRFRYGDPASLPDEPLRYLATQMQEDVALLDQRNGELFVDAGVISFAADWSFGFDVGMSFLEIHGPVPRVRKEGIITRAHDFLLRLQPHEPYRRTNWTLTVGRRLDVSTERYPEWGPDRETVQWLDDDEFGQTVHLRVEVQHLVRLPDSGAVMFLIRTYLLPLADLAGVEPWRLRTAEVLADLPEDMADYKGIIKFRDRAATWLRAAAPQITAPPVGLPHWPQTPPEVEPTGATYLIVAIGNDALTATTAGDWVSAAEAAAPTRLLLLDSLDIAHDRSTLRSVLAEIRTGARLLVTGGQFDVMQALALARSFGAIPDELACFVTSTTDLPMYCAHCRDTFRVVGSPEQVVDCPGCARRVQIHAHHSASRGSFLASYAGEQK